MSTMRHDGPQGNTRGSAALHSAAIYPHTRKEAIAQGLGYYHGKTCPHCGTTLKRVKKYDCHECHRSASIEHIRAYVQTPEGAAKKRENRAAYRERLRRQTPSWVDRKAIAPFYAEAKRLGLEVDHYYPLRGKFVSGLHVAGNLQLLTAEANRAKSNNFNPDWSDSDKALAPVLGA